MILALREQRVQARRAEIRADAVEQAYDRLFIGRIAGIRARLDIERMQFPAERSEFFAIARGHCDIHPGTRKTPRQRRSEPGSYARHKCSFARRHG